MPELPQEDEGCRACAAASTRPNSESRPESRLSAVHTIEGVRRNHPARRANGAPPLWRGGPARRREAGGAGPGGCLVPSCAPCRSTCLSPGLSCPAAYSRWSGLLAGPADLPRRERAARPRAVTRRANGVGSPAGPRVFQPAKVEGLLVPPQRGNLDKPAPYQDSGAVPVALGVFTRFLLCSLTYFVFIL